MQVLHSTTIPAPAHSTVLSAQGSAQPSRPSPWSQAEIRKLVLDTIG
ncbi:hypothetical protein [Teichococcus vastitatis]|nr:hypothetical protein [Pseudoroseomonas vastitatis]